MTFYKYYRFIICNRSKFLNNKHILLLDKYNHNKNLAFVSYSLTQNYQYCNEPNPKSNKPGSKPNIKLEDKEVEKNQLDPSLIKKNYEPYIFTKIFDYVEKYTEFLEKNISGAKRIYQTLVGGMKSFFADMKLFMKINRIAQNSPEGFKALTRKELELIIQLPQDMLKVAPVLVLSALPFVGNAIFALALLFPRHTLTSHFWTKEQKEAFQEIYIKQRLMYNRKVFRYLQYKRKKVKKSPLEPQLRKILGLLGSGQHPNVQDIIATKDIFTTTPYNYKSLSMNHISNLRRIYGLPFTFFKRRKLLEHIYGLHNMDLAIKREGDVHNMSTEDLKWAAYIRGLNSNGLSDEELIKWLKTWVDVSLTIEETHISLLLHLPILIGYNHPNNWKLIHKKKV